MTTDTPPITIAAGLRAPLLLEGTKATLDAVDGFEVVATAPDAPSTLRAVATHQPRIVLVDVRFHREDEGFVDAVAEACPTARTVFLIDHEPGDCFLLQAGTDPRRVADVAAYTRRDCCLAAVRDGAGGCCWSESPPEDLIDTIRRAAGNEVAADPWLEAETLHRLLARRTGTDASPSLSPRQEAVVDLVSRGLSNAEIAAELDLAEQTVKNHVTRAMKVLGVRNRVELACSWVRVLGFDRWKARR